MNIDLFLMHLLNGSDNLFADRMALVLTNGLTWTGLYLMLFYIIIRNNETMLQIGLAVLGALVCVAIASSVTDAVVKPLVARWRPNNDPLLKYTFDVVDGIRGKGYSFFSAHAANTMSLAVFFALLMRSRVLTIALLVWSVVNGWTRIYLGMHYPSDVLCGMLFGAAVGWGYTLLTVRLTAPSLRILPTSPASIQVQATTMPTSVRFSVCWRSLWCMRWLCR